MLSVAVSWDLYLETHSAKVLGAVGLVQIVPAFAFALLAGHLADRHNRRHIMMASQGLTVFASLLLVAGIHSVAGIYACLFLVSVTRTFQMPIRGALVPEIVPTEIVPNAVTWTATLFESANVGGPALAGILLATIGSRVVYGFQVACAAIVLLCLSQINFDRKHEAQPGSPLEGLRFIRDNKLILSAVSLDLFAYLFGGATALLPIFAVDRGRYSPRRGDRARLAASRSVRGRNPDGGDDRAPAGHPPRGSGVAVERRRLRSGDRRVRGVAESLVLLPDAGADRRVR
jgi:MFS family permease